MRIPMKIRSSYLWAGLVALAVVGWMVSDDLLSQSDDADKEMSSAAVGTGDALADEVDDSAKSNAQPASAERNFIVSAREVKNETIPRLIRANGIVEPGYEVTVSSKIEITLARAIATRHIRTTVNAIISADLLAHIYNVYVMGS